MTQKALLVINHFLNLTTLIGPRPSPLGPAVSLELEFQGRLPWKVRLEWRQFDLSQYNLILVYNRQKIINQHPTLKLKWHPRYPRNYLFVIILWISKSCEFDLTVLIFRFICDSKFSITLGLNLFLLDTLGSWEIIKDTLLLSCWNIRLHDWWDHLVVVLGLSRQSPASVSATHRGWEYLVGIHPFRTEIPISKKCSMSSKNFFGIFFSPPQTKNSIS